MTDDRPILIEVFRHNLWANSQMLDACRDLSDEQLATELAGTYGRLDQTLIHLAASDVAASRCALAPCSTGATG